MPVRNGLIAAEISDNVPIRVLTKQEQLRIEYCASNICPFYLAPFDCKCSNLSILLIFFNRMLFGYMPKVMQGRQDRMEKEISELKKEVSGVKKSVDDASKKCMETMRKDMADIVI